MFVSYAQNFEDVILWRTLKHINNGFYIDIGAQDPVVDSVSRGFYEKGWRGIHAEATAYYADKIRQDRPDEIVFQAAVGVGHGSIRFFEFPDTGLSTSDPDISLKHQAAGLHMVETDVPLMPLSVVMAQAGDREVHWLKVDVEGMETSVIESWSPSAVRPWIVVVESMRPNSQEPSFEEWEPTLLDKGYKFAYFDGLSRHYVSNSHPELLEYFGPGPNVFDDFELAQSTTSVRLKCSRLIDFANRPEQLYPERVRLHIKEGALLDALDREAQRDAELHKIYHSLSWRLTYPLREMNALKAKLVSLPRQLMRDLFEKAIRWLSKNQKWKGRALRELRRFPGLRARLEAFARSRGYGVMPQGLYADHEVEWSVAAPKGFPEQWKQLLENASTKSKR